MCTQNSRLLLILLVSFWTTVFTIISNSLAARQEDGSLSKDGVRAYCGLARYGWRIVIKNGCAGCFSVSHREKVFSLFRMAIPGLPLVLLIYEKTVRFTLVSGPVPVSGELFFWHFQTYIQ